MPTKEQMLSVADRIEWLESKSYLREEGRTPEPASDTARPWWEDLSREEQQLVLDEEVDWEGFTEAEKLDVERRVLDGEEAGFWMAGASTQEAVVVNTNAKRYQVWQADRPREPGEGPLDFPEAYTKVAEVRANGLREAVNLTTHIDRPWEEKPGVVGEAGARSTRIGDAIVNPSGTAYRLDGDTFTQIGPSPARLHREWLDDAAQRPLHEKGVQYSDEFNRMLDEYASRAVPRSQDKEIER